MAKEVYAEPAANVVREKLNGCTVIIAAQPFFKSKNAFSFKSQLKKIKMEAILARTIVLGLDILSPSDICGDLKRCVRNESEFLCAKLCGMEKVCDAFSMQD